MISKWQKVKWIHWPNYLLWSLVQHILLFFFFFFFFVSFTSMSLSMFQKDWCLRSTSIHIIIIYFFFLLSRHGESQIVVIICAKHNIKNEQMEKKKKKKWSPWPWCCLGEKMRNLMPNCNREKQQFTKGRELNGKKEHSVFENKFVTH